MFLIQRALLSIAVMERISFFPIFDIYGFLKAVVARFVLIEKLGSSKLFGILGLKQSYLRERLNNSFLKASILCKSKKTRQSAKSRGDESGGELIARVVCGANTATLKMGYAY